MAFKKKDPNVVTEYMGFKYPLKRLKKEQEDALHSIRRRCCELYNACLQERKQAYRNLGISIRRMRNKETDVPGQQCNLVAVKQERPEYAEIHSAVLQNVTAKVELSFQAFFSRVKKKAARAGYPRYKASDRYRSFKFPGLITGADGYPSAGGVKFVSVSGKTAKLQVHGVPGLVQVHWYRPMIGKAKTASFVFDAGKWYVSFSCDVTGKRRQELPPTDRTLGIDLGLQSFIATDSGETVEPPRFLRQKEARLKQEQRAISRCVRGSRRRRKKRALIARLHRKIRNARLDWHHKLARDLVQRYDRIAAEDLNVAGLARTRLAKSIYDAGWSSFLTILGQKASATGRVFVRVDPAHTSQDCSRCGYREPKELSDRVHECKQCGLVLDRDVNAARNIRRKAFDEQALSPVGTQEAAE